MDNQASLNRLNNTTHPNYKHGESGTRLHCILHNMNYRCTSPKDTYWHRYGGRGIQVCPEWQTFPAFKHWALSNGYSDALSIDRYPDPNGHYHPDNCRWATQQQQCSNTVRNRRITFNGVTRTLAEWARHTGINRGTINSRLQVGHSIAHALTAPIKGA